MATLPVYARTRTSEAAPIIAELRMAVPDHVLAAALGIKIVALDWKKHPIPVARCAYLLHLMVFGRGNSVTMFDVLTLGKYAGKTPQISLRTPQADSSCGVSLVVSELKNLDS